MNWKEIRIFLDSIVSQVYHEVKPLVFGGGGELVQQLSSGKDLVAKIDQVASDSIRKALAAQTKYRVALLDEKKGVFESIHDNPEIGLVVDEIDGTRLAMLKIPISTICMAAFPMNEEPLLKNVRAGAIQTLTGERFSFCKGGGIWRDDTRFTPLLETPPLDRLRFLYEMAGGYQQLAAMYLQPFDKFHPYGYGSFNSAAYMGTRLLIGGAHFYVHLGQRIRRDWPELEEEMVRIHGGALGQYAWDLATTTPMLWEAGFVSTKTDGSPLTDVRIDDGSPTNVRDVLIAAPDVHRHVLNLLNRQAVKLLERKREILELFKNIAVI